MSIRHLSLLTLVLGGYLFLSCSTRKNTWTSRNYHNLVSRYNIYFNAKEAMKDAKKQLRDAHKDDLFDLLPVYITDNELTRKAAHQSWKRVLEKSAKIISKHSIKIKPRRRSNRSERYRKLASRKEFNNWVDESYFFIGQISGYNEGYYTSIASFDKILREYDFSHLLRLSNLWQARNYTQLEQYDEAKRYFEYFEADREVKRKESLFYYLTQTDFFLRQKDYDNARFSLERALRYRYHRYERSRHHFLLGQLYERTGELEKAEKMYHYAAKKGVARELKYYARLKWKSFRGDSSEKQEARMLQAAKRRKNSDFKGVIYFALAELKEQQQQLDQAVKYYKMAAGESKDRPSLRGTAYTRLAQYYFTKKEYVTSGSYYDSSLMTLSPKSPLYLSNEKVATPIIELGKQWNRDAYLDSMVRLSYLDSVSLDSIVRSLEEKEQREALQKALAKQQQAEEQEGIWFFYNSKLLNNSRREFQNTWGNIPLSDNWAISAAHDFQEDNLSSSSSTSSTDTKRSSAAPKKNSFVTLKKKYLKDLPQSDEQRLAMNEEAELAISTCVILLAEDINDLEAAYSTYLKSQREHPNNIYLPYLLYTLYNSAVRLGDMESSTKYKQELVQKHPQSMFAKAVQDPLFLSNYHNLQNAHEKSYERTYLLYRQGKYTEASEQLNHMLSQSMDSSFRCRVELLSILTQVPFIGQPSLKQELNRFRNKWAASPQAEFATKIISMMDSGQFNSPQALKEKGYISDSVKEEQPYIPNTLGNPFVDVPDDVHYYVLLVPTTQAKGLNFNQLKFNIAIYNTDHFISKDLDILKDRNDNYAMIVVQSLDNYKEAMVYFNSLIRTRNVFTPLDGVKYFNCIISARNFVTARVEKRFNEYFDYFHAHSSPYVNHTFPDDIYPEPESLLRRIFAEENEENEEAEEEGNTNFVVVNTSALDSQQQRDAIQDEKPQFSVNDSEEHYFVIATQHSDPGIFSTMVKLNQFNIQSFAAQKLPVEKAKGSSFLYLIVKGLANKKQAIYYAYTLFPKREVFEALKRGTFRYFLISQSNMRTLLNKEVIPEYLEFYKEYYLKR